MSAQDYQIGFGIDSSGSPLWIGYRAAIVESDETIIVVIGRGPHREEKNLPPKKMLEFECGPAVWQEENGGRKFAGFALERQWFENRCREANCTWFVPLAKRMAAGEEVSIQEIQAEYFAANRTPMPAGRWSQLFV